MFENERGSRAYYDMRAARYDWANRIAAFLRGTSPTRERTKAVCRLMLEEWDSVLEVCVGTGTNIPLINRRVGRSGRIVGLDISRGMLGVCVDKTAARRLAAEVVEGEAGHLPFIDDGFDAVFHHGGIAEFGDRHRAIEEMYRVVKPGGRVVVCDVGIHRDGWTPMMNRFLLRFQPEYRQPPPMESIPDTAEDMRLRWYFGQSWYMIDFRKPIQI